MEYPRNNKSPRSYKNVLPFDVHCHFCGKEYKHSGTKIQDRWNNPAGHLDIIQCEECRRYGGLAIGSTVDDVLIEMAYIRKSVTQRYHEPMEICTNEAFQMDDYGNFRIKVIDSEGKCHYSYWGGYTCIVSLKIGDRVFIGVSQSHAGDIEPETVLELTHYVEPNNEIKGLKELFNSIDSSKEPPITLNHIGFIVRGKTKVSMWGGRIAFVSMDEVILSLGKVTENLLMEYINDGGFGVEKILGAVVDVYYQYEQGHDIYMETKIVGDVSEQEADDIERAGL